MDVVIIPAYQPETKFSLLVEQVLECDRQVIVVDDGSGREYRDIFCGIQNLCTLLVHPQNRGKGAAIKTALAYIKRNLPDCRTIAVMDADGQHRAEDVGKVLKEARGRRNAMVLGVRLAGKNMPFKSRLGNGVTRLVFSLVSGVKVSDTQTGLRAFDAELMEELLGVKGERYEYETNVLLHLARKRIPIREVEIATIYRDKENSTSHFRAVQDSVRIYKDIFRFALSSFSSFLLDYALFSALMILFPHSGGWVLLCNVAARLVSAFYNYSMNCWFVFCAEKRIKTAAHYFALAFGVLLANNLFLQVFIRKFRIQVHLAKLLTECLLFVISWLIQSLVIFRKEQIQDRYYHSERGKA